MYTMKKAIVILCLFVLLPLAVSAQSKTVFKDVEGYLCLIDEQGNRNIETLKKYDNCEFSYYDASSLTPRYLSLSIKLSGSEDKTAILLDSQTSYIYKLDFDGKDVYQITDVLGNGTKHTFSFVYFPDNPDILEIVRFRYRENGVAYPFSVYTFMTKAAPVIQILEWIYNNHLIPHEK